jgi:hypothetical protein
MKGRPGVYVAGGIAEVMDVVEQVLRDDDSDVPEVLVPSSGRPDAR